LYQKTGNKFTLKIRIFRNPFRCSTYCFRRRNL